MITEYETLQQLLDAQKLPTDPKEILSFSQMEKALHLLGEHGFQCSDIIVEQLGHGFAAVYVQGQKLGQIHA